MTVRLRASVIPGMLILTALALTGCTSQGTIGAGADGGPLPGGATSSRATGTSGTSGASTSASGTSAPSSTNTDSASSSAPASSSASSADPSALASSLKTLNKLWTDPGCKTALAGFSDYLYALQQGQAQAIAAIPGAAAKIHQGSQQTAKPQAAVQMNKAVTDLQAMAAAAKQGQTPDKGPVKVDFQNMGSICSQP